MKENLSLHLSGLGAFLTRSMLMTLVPLFGVRAGFSATEVGVLVAAYSTAPTLLAVPLGRWVDGWGSRRVLMLGAGLTIAAGILFVLLASHFWLFLATQFLAGTGRTLSWIAAQTLVTQLATPEKDRQIGIFTVYTSLGAVFGPLAAGFSIDVIDFEFAFWMFALFGVVMFGLALVLRDPPGMEASRPLRSLSRRDRPDPSPDRSPPDRDSAARHTTRSLLGNPAVQITLAFSSITMFTSNIRQSFFPIYLEAIAYSPSTIGFLVGLSSFVSTLVRPLTAWMSEKVGWTRMILICIVTAVVGMSAVPLFVSLFPLVLLAALNGIGTGFNQPLGLMLLGSATPRSARGAVMGLRTGLNGLAMAVAPLALGIMTDLLTLAMAFYLSGIALALLAVYPLIRARALENEPTPGTVSGGTKSPGG